MLDFDPNGGALETDLERSILVCIVGSNQTLAEACRVNIEHLCPAGYHIQECGSLDASDGCDIYIWDFESSPCLPNAMAAADEAIKIVVVKKSSLSSVRRMLPGSGFTYLQSPVTSLSLRAVLESSVAQLQLRGDEGLSSSRLKLDRDRILQRLLQTNLKLREHDEDRTNFLARSVHDIRGPLMAIQGYCGLLLAGQLGSMDPEQTQILERMQRSLSRLCRLAEAMMDLGTGSLGTNKLRLEQASIEACVQQAVHEVLPFVEKKRISLNVDVEAPNGTLLFDAQQLEQVLVNILDNACKFTPRRGSITVTGRWITAEGLGKVGLQEATAGYRIDITDNGRGIDPDHIEQVFDEDTSFGDPMDRSGSGLGLAICRMIIRAHNGRIWADPRTQGASFSFVLPVARSFSDSHLSSVAI
jgi:signal transduction histidine kinase